MFFHAIHIRTYIRTRYYVRSLCYVYSMQIMVCEMINLLLEIWLKYDGNMKFTLKYICSMQLIAQS